MDKNLGALIRAKRERDGLSVREAGAQSGVAFSTLSRIENGATPSVGVYHRLMSWLDGVGATLPQPPMTLRDWFAGQAIPGVLASLEGVGSPEEAATFVAETCGMIADALLAERNRHEP